MPPMKIASTKALRVRRNGRGRGPGPASRSIGRSGPHSLRARKWRMRAHPRRRAAAMPCSCIPPARTTRENSAAKDSIVPCRAHQHPPASRLHARRLPWNRSRTKMKATRPMSRWQAAGIHIGITIVVAILVGTLLFGIWYPPPYFGAGGADHLMIVLVSVDLTIGPLLTLIVFKSGKWGMKFDLCAIALLQMAALGYGLSVMSKSRPIFLVGNIDRFVLGAFERDRRCRHRQGARRRVPHALLDRRAARRRVDPGRGGAAAADLRRVFRPRYRELPRVLPALWRCGAGAGQARQTARDAAQEGWRQHRGRLAGRNHRDPASVVWLPVVSRAYDLSMLALIARPGSRSRPFRSIRGRSGREFREIAHAASGLARILRLSGYPNVARGAPSCQSRCPASRSSS